MRLLLNRFVENADATLGVLHVDDKATCFTLEDEHRLLKVSGETRIPAGRYQIKLRTEGGMHARYTEKFGKRHRGMLWLQDVPNFTWVYIHIGNRESHTDGCILTGYGLDMTGEWRTTNSTDSYFEIAEAVYAALDNNEEVWITINDEE